MNDKKKRMCFLWAVTFVIIFFSIGFLNNCADKGHDNKIYSFIPEKAKAFIFLNIHNLLNDESIKESLPSWENALQEMVDDERFSDFLKQTEINIKRDLSCFVFIFKDLDFENPRGSLIANISYNKDKIIKALKSLQVEIIELSYKAITLYEFLEKEGNSQNTVIGFLDYKHLIIGHLDEVKKVIDVSNERKNNIFSNKYFSNYMKNKEIDSFITMFFPFPGEFLNEQAGTDFEPFKFDFNVFEAFIFAFNGKEMEFILNTGNQEELRKFVDFLKGIKSMFSIINLESFSEEERIGFELFKHINFERYSDGIKATAASDKIIDIFNDEIKENYLKTTNKKKMMITMWRLEVLGKAIEEYKKDHKYSPKFNNIQDMSKELGNSYLKDIYIVDGWNRYFLYGYNDQGDYWIGSAGSDGIFDGFDQHGKYAEKWGLNGMDIMFCNGRFILYPKTSQ